MECDYCGGTSGEFSDLGDHVACEAECQRLLDAQICTRCRTADVSGLRTVYCESCGPDAEHVGYPGG